MPLYDKAFWLALFFILGVGFAGVGVNIWLGLLLSIVVGLVAFTRTLRFVFAAGLICLAGYFYYHFYVVLGAEHIPFGQESVYEGVLVTEPELGIKSSSVDIKLYKPYGGVLRVYLPATEDVRYGDVVSLSGVAEKSPSGKLNTLSFPADFKVLKRGVGSPVKKALFGLKGKLSENLRVILPPERAALMTGILLGERAEFTPQLEEALRLSGTTHIVALSGYNIAILVTTLSVGFSYLLNRRRAFWLSLVVIPAFVIMTGAGASVVRAGIMGLIALLAVQQERIYSFRNAITLTALAMLVYNPRLLTEDVGFQLSFSALMGIVYVYPWLTQRLRLRDTGFLGWKTNALQTLSAQAATLPIVLTTFGFVSPTAPLANILVLEFVPLTMLLGFLGAVSGFFSYYLSLLVGWATNLLLSYDIFIVKLLAFNWT